jgi:SAM-dependent methyltransferase
MGTERGGTADLPGGGLDTAGMPGHWLLARLGKRVLRPGGLGLTREMLGGLAIRTDDAVIEFAPGLGVTARLILDRKPHRYTGIERDAEAMAWTRENLPRHGEVSVAVGAADATGLPPESASVVLGESLLSMNSDASKQAIVAEACRLLRPGGRYGIHELCLVPDDLAPEQRQAIHRELSEAAHVGAHPLAAWDWTALLEAAGLKVVQIGYAPMHLLRPRRMIADEGWRGALRVAGNILRDRAARRRVLAMHRVFERHRDNLRGIYLVAEKPA